MGIAYSIAVMHVLVHVHVPVHVLVHVLVHDPCMCSYSYTRTTFASAPTHLYNMVLYF